MKRRPPKKDRPLPASLPRPKGWQDDDREMKRLPFGPDELVLHHYVGCGATWFASCHRIGIHQYELRASSLEAAQREAVGLVRARLSSALDALAEALS